MDATSGLAEALRDLEGRGPVDEHEIQYAIYKLARDLEAAQRERRDDQE
jgi:hypothetical protein